jgi:ribosomal protein L7/L12
MQVENMLTLKVARDSKAAALQFRVDAAQPVTQATRKSPAQLASEAAEFRMQQQQKQEAAALKNKQGLLQ